MASTLQLTGEGLFINGRFLTQQTSGVQAFAAELTEEMIEMFPGIRILVPASFNTAGNKFKEKLIHTGNSNGHLWEQTALKKFIRRSKGSMLLNFCNTGPLGLKNQAVTIHDLAFVVNPEWFSSAFGLWYRFLIPKLVKQSAHVFTVSASVKAELAERFTISESDITVVGNKVSRRLLGADEKKPGSNAFGQREFFLMVGSDNPRKNFAFAEKVIAEHFPQFDLVIAGGTHSNFSKTTHQESDNIIRLGFTSDEELKWLYKNAKAQIAPSFYEGFGIPNLEAMAFGCPVLCSDIASFRGVCGTAAWYFDPAKEESLVAAVNGLQEKIEEVKSKTIEGKGIFTSFQNQSRSLQIIKALYQ